MVASSQDLLYTAVYLRCVANHLHLAHLSGKLSKAIIGKAVTITKEKENVFYSL